MLTLTKGEAQPFDSNYSGRRIRLLYDIRCSEMTDKTIATSVLMLQMGSLGEGVTEPLCKVPTKWLTDMSNAKGPFCKVPIMGSLIAFQAYPPRRIFRFIRGSIGGRGNGPSPVRIQEGDGTMREEKSYNFI